MSDSLPDRLLEALGTTPPDTVAALPDDVRDRLAAQVVDARERLVREGRAATERALQGVPLPVRGLVRRALS